MGTWICHIRVAEKLVTRIPHLDLTAFMLGSLAPDSGIPNQDWTVFDPPKEVTHYLHRGEDESQIRDLIFYRELVAGLDLQADPILYSLRLAYFIHLMCDGLWARRIGLPTKRGYADLRARLGSSFWDTIKEDWYGQDHCYLRDHPESAFWKVVMPAPYPPACVPFLSPEAVNRQLDYIRGYYSQPNPDRVLDRPFPYLNGRTMDRFVDECAAAALEVHGLLSAQPAPQEMLSSLDLLPPGDSAPYDLPLGDVVRAPS